MDNVEIARVNQAIREFGDSIHAAGECIVRAFREAYSMNNAKTLARLEAKEKSRYLEHTLALEAEHNIFTDSPVHINSDAGLVGVKASWREGAIGLAKRDIAKGEIVAYNPQESTEDIVIMEDVEAAELKAILRQHNAEFCQCGHEIGFGDIAWNTGWTEAGTDYSVVQIRCEVCQTELDYFHSWMSDFESNAELLSVLQRDWTRGNRIL